MNRNSKLIGLKQLGLQQKSDKNFLENSLFLKNVPPSQRLRRAYRSLALVVLFFLSFILQSLLFNFDVPEVRAESGLSAGSQARVANTDGDGVRLRKDPDAGAGTIATLGENWLVTIKGGPFTDSKGNSFYQIEWSNRTGYAMTQYLTYSGKTSSATGSSKSLPVGGQARVSGTNGDGVRMRQQANVAAPTLNILSESYLVTVLGGPFNDNQGNSFFKIEWAGTTGYVSSTYLNSAPKNAVAGTGGSMRVTNTDGDPIRFRLSVGRDGGVNGYVYEGQVLKLLAGPYKDTDGNSWYKLDRSGEVGYVDASYVQRTTQSVTKVTQVTTAPVKDTNKVAPAQAPQPKPVPAPASNGPLGERIANYALQFVGWRYVWGGHSPDAGGFDCSGLVHWVLSQNGISAGFSVDADLGVGASVPADQLQPGDVLIWANTYTAGPSHAGIYLGGGRFVHAENYSTGVTINNLSDGYYASRFYAARRPGV